MRTFWKPTPECQYVLLYELYGSNNHTQRPRGHLRAEDSMSPTGRECKLTEEEVEQHVGKWQQIPNTHSSLHDEPLHDESLHDESLHDECWRHHEGHWHSSYRFYVQKDHFCCFAVKWDQLSCDITVTSAFTLRIQVIMSLWTSRWGAFCRLSSRARTLPEVLGASPGPER